MPPLFILSGIIFTSPFFSHFGIGGVFIYGLLLFVSLILYITFSISFRLFSIFGIFLALTLISSSVTALYWLDARYLFSNIYIIAAFSILPFLTAKGIDKSIDIASIFLVLILCGSIFGFLLALNGASPLLSIPNPDGRLNYFYYTTLTNSVSDNFIRPSGIYDEPGTLSFYICGIASIRHLSGKDNRLTWTLLFLGFVTFSIAHLVYVVVHLSSERLTKKNLMLFILISTITISATFILGINSIIEDNFIQRLSISEDTSYISGDNRSFRMFNAIEKISNNTNILYYGADPSCRFDYNDCQTRYSPIGENPLMPIFISGIYVSWIYYMILLILFLSPLFFGKRFIPALGFGALLLQRPEALLFSGALISSSVFLLAILPMLKSRVIIRK